MKDIFKVFRAVQLDFGHVSQDDINCTIVSLNDCSMKTRQLLNLFLLFTEDISQINNLWWFLEFLLDLLFFIGDDFEQDWVYPFEVLEHILEFQILLFYKVSRNEASVLIY